MIAPRSRVLPLLVVAMLVVATGCGGSDGDEGSGAARTITIANLEFAPETLEVKVGDTITVDNKDEAEHSVTAIDRSFDTGAFGKGTKTFTVTRAGRFEYACEVHPFMTHRFLVVA